MPIPVMLNTTLQEMDLSTPDGMTVIWPLPRNLKIDILVVLGNMLKKFAPSIASKIPIIAEGSFKASQLKEGPQQTTRPVICLSRSGDPAQRFGIGEVIQFLVWDSKKNQMVDVTDEIIKTFNKGENIIARGQCSLPVVDVEIYDMNLQRVEYMYDLVKMCLLAAENAMMSGGLGYLDFIRVDGVDDAPIVLQQEGGNHPIFQRTLTYRGQCFDFIEGIPPLVSLIESTFTGDTVDPTGQSSLTVQV